MSVQLKKTDAEEAILAALTSAGANTAILDKGLPTRRVEQFHYTDLRSLIKAFPAASNSADNQNTPFEKLIEGATIAFNNAEGSLAELPKGVTGALVQSPTPVPQNVEISANIIGALNEALVANGAALSVAPNSQIEQPIILEQNIASATSCNLRHSVNVGEGANAVIVEHHKSDDSENLQNTVTNVTLDKGATATLVVFQEHGLNTTRLAQLNVHLAQDSDITILMLNAGGKVVRQEVHIAVQGENSNITMKGVNLVGDKAHIDVTTTMAHNVPNTTADEMFRNVVTGSGKGVFQGQIRVAQIAQKTDAKMACNTLLLSDDADFSSKPELEIFADDVLCAHGATVTDIDEDHLFYLRARGISEKIARNLLVKAFVEEVFEDLDLEALGESLNARIERWLDMNG
ncbi:MAG: Fe-S cluster assembly protein SufD [Nitratireductor sp.]